MSDEQPDDRPDAARPAAPAAPRPPSRSAVRAEIVMKLVEARFGHVEHQTSEDVLAMDDESLARVEARLTVVNDVDELFG